MPPQFAINVDHFNGRSAGAQHGKQYPAVLVDVSEFVDYPQNGLLPVLPQMVRLQTLNECRCFGMDTQEPLSLVQRIFESIGSTTDGEHITFSGLIVLSKHQFPHQIIEGGAQILETITHNQSESSWHRPLGVECESWPIQARVLIAHHMARVCLKVPHEFGFKSLAVEYGPEYFLLNGIERSHSGMIGGMKSKPEPSAEFKNFDSTVRRVLSVSKTELQRREAEYQAEREGKPKRGPKPRV